jgi:hypothetical protein
MLLELDLMQRSPKCLATMVLHADQVQFFESGFH